MLALTFINKALKNNREKSPYTSGFHPGLLHLSIFKRRLKLDFNPKSNLPPSAASIVENIIWIMNMIGQVFDRFKSVYILDLA